jgi:hypothetical protein
MAEADQAYHNELSDDSRAHYIRAVITLAQLDALKVINAGIKAEGQRVTTIALKDRRAMAQALLEDRREEFIAKVKASGAMQDMLRQLYAKEATALLCKLARKSKHSHRT